MIKRYIAPSLLLLAINTIAPTHAGEVGLHFRHLTVNDGLPQSTVNAIYQDETGLIWLGTRNGLARYDGTAIRVLQHDDQRPNSLVNNYVQSIVGDEKGLWVGTRGGLSFVERKTGHIKNFLMDRSNPRALQSTSVRTLFRDKQGQLWIGTHGGGLARYEADGDQFTTWTTTTTTENDIPDNRVWGIAEAAEGGLWLVTLGGGISHFDPKTEVFENYRATTPISSQGPASDKIRGIVADPKQSNVYWLATEQGLDRMDGATGTFQHFRTEQGLVANSLYCLAFDSDEQLWVGSYSAGLQRFDPVEGTFRTYLHDRTNPASLGHDSVRSIYQDQTGTHWIGTLSEGVSIFSETAFSTIWEDSPTTPGLPGERVLSILGDGDDVLVGTNRGLIQMDGDTRLLQNLPLIPGFENEQINTLYTDSRGHLWIGTMSGVLRRKAGTKTVEVFANVDNPRNLLDPRISTIVEDSAGNLWFGNQCCGLNRLAPGQTQFTNYPAHGDRTGPSGNQIYTSLQDQQGRVWFASSNGLSYHQPGEERPTFQHYFESERGLTSNVVVSLYEDTKGGLWVGTVEGLNHIINAGQKGHELIRSYRDLPDRVINGIQQDTQGNLWLSGTKGLYRFQPETGDIRHFTVSDGLQGNEFIGASQWRAADGTLYFGGTNGLTFFNPDQVKLDQVAPTVILSDLRIFDRGVDELDAIMLPSTLEDMTELTLNYKQVAFTFVFGALHFTAPEQNRYQYQMEGFDPDWQNTNADNPRATYTNLAPGKYTFRYKAANPHDVWSAERQVNLNIEPPPWRTWWAYSLYVILGALLIAGFLAYQQGRLRQKEVLIGKLRHLDQLKNDFLANTSHELRTPLNGIVGLSESLLEGSAGPLNQQAQKELNMIAACGKRLGLIVNDMLDFTRLKNNHISVNLESLALRPMVAEVMFLLEREAAGKKLELRNMVEEDAAVSADPLRLQQILFNLIGNAVKFTQQGHVAVRSVLVQERIEIHVEDTGPGISEDRQKRIFEPFEQGEPHETRGASGTGLGLAIAKKLVHLHGGDITVRSLPGHGSSFRFTLSVGLGKPEETKKTHVDEMQAVLPVHDSVATQDLDFTESWRELQGTVLVVDDDETNRQVLTSQLNQSGCRVIQAEDGPQALEIIEHTPPDLVLLDIMMPGMSGYEVCEKIRETYKVAELPIIFISAKDQVSDRIKGFVLGGNDYMCKPFSADELRCRIYLHLRLREALLQLLELQGQLVLQDKMASLGMFTAGIAHEVANPVGFVSVAAENMEVELDEFKTFLFDLLEEDGDPEMEQVFRQRIDPVGEHLKIILEGCDRIREITRIMQRFARTKNEPETHRLAELADNTMSLVRTGFKRKVDFKLEEENDAVIHGHGAKINQALLNLMVNACHAIVARQEAQRDSTPGKLIVRIRESAGQALLSISDSGTGIEESELEKIFQPLYTTKPEGKGTGLGLFITREIMKEHGGKITVESRIGEGATFTLHFPLATRDPKN